MVDWKTIGKRALDITKDITEKSVDSYQEWKDDPERIAKVETKKAEKKVAKEEKKTSIVEKKSRKKKKKKKESENFKVDPIITVGIVEESTFKGIKRNKVTKIIQERPNYVIVKQGRNSFPLELVKVEYSDKKNSSSGALAGAILAGSTGAIIGNSMKSSRIYSNLYVYSPESNEPPHVIRFTAEFKEAAQLLRLQVKNADSMEEN